MTNTFTFRPFMGKQDFAAAAEIQSASFAADGIPFAETAQSIENYWTGRSDFAPERDVIFAEMNGQPAGYGRVRFYTNDVGEQVAWHEVCAAKEARAAGAYPALFKWCIAHSTELARANPHTGPRFFQTSVVGAMTEEIALLQNAEFTPFRYGFLMKRDLSAPIPDLPLPAGVETRAVAPAQFKAIFAARNEAFRDHFGHREATESEMEGWGKDPFSRQDLWQVAWDARTNEVAGEVHVSIITSDNEAYGLKRGWTDPIAVRRPYRRQGLAKALIARGMMALRAVGMTEACLGVDAQNPNGALKLYEDMGFVVDMKTFQYRKELEV
ncbi:MAG TPA: GNAT family N-acetyltransferase [Thermoflexales bacterium]|nr:GNAT family N-acetyltransferase [Thermoflexales bacterium]